jgi:hypothetical protein
VRRLIDLRFVCAAAALGVLLAGCGGGGVSSGATVSVYVAAPLCQGAQRQLQREAGRVEDLRVRAVCLPPAESGGRPDLARIGANARRATEDSSSVAYLEAAGPAAKFSQTIVETADVAWVRAVSGASAMRRVLGALAEADLSDLRGSVREALDEAP